LGPVIKQIVQWKKRCRIFAVFCRSSF